MNPLATISRGIGYGPLATITQGFITTVELPPIEPVDAQFEVVAASAFFVVLPKKATFNLSPQPALVIVDGTPAVLTILGRSADVAIEDMQSIFEVVRSEDCDGLP